MEVTQDLHVHTYLSICAISEATPEAYLANAKRFKLTTLGIADHMWDRAIPETRSIKTLNNPWEGFYNIQDFDRICRIRKEFAKLDLNGVRILYGCEAEYDPLRHSIGVSEAVAEQLDFMIVPNSHTHIIMPINYYEPHDKHAEFMYQAYMDIISDPLAKYITAMAHPFEAVCSPYDNKELFQYISDDMFRRAFTTTAEKGVAIEINLSELSSLTDKQILNHPRIHMFALAKECGCRFTFGSDAHDPDGQDGLLKANLISDALGLTEADILFL